MSRAFESFADECRDRVRHGTLDERTLQAYLRAIYPGDPDDWRTKADAIRLEEEVGGLSIAEAGQPRFLMDYLADVADEYPAIAELHYKVLSGVFTMLKKFGLFDYSPMKLVDHPCPGGPAQKQRALTPDGELPELVSIARRHHENPRTGTWLYYCLMFVLGTGLRLGEALALRWCDITGLNDERAIVHVAATIVKVAGVKPYRKPKRKSGNPYYVMLPTWLTTLLREYRDLSQPADDTVLIFRARNRGKNHGVIDPSTADDNLRRLRQGSPAVGWVQFGNLRDTVATEITARTGDPRLAPVLKVMRAGGCPPSPMS
jgi:integrase